MCNMYLLLQAQITITQLQLELDATSVKVGQVSLTQVASDTNALRQAHSMHDTTYGTNPCFDDNHGQMLRSFVT